MRDRVLVQELSMSGTGRLPRYIKSPSEAWETILDWILTDFGLRGSDSTCQNPQNPQFHISGDEKHKVEHLSFLKHKKLLPNSSWAPRSMIFPNVLFYKKKTFLYERDLAL